MGAWAEYTFGNDSTCDWIGIFLRNPGLPAVESAINAVLNADDFLDSDEAWDCLAACEVIARWQGRWGRKNAYSSALDEWIEVNPTTVPDRLKSNADRAIERILSPNSELLALWDDGGYDREWHQEIDDLRDRVKGC